MLRLINFPNIVIFFIAFNPLTTFYFNQYYIPDMFFNALLSLLLLLSFCCCYLASSIVLILMFLTRETTIILSAVIIIILYLNKKKEAYYYLIATILGLMGLMIIKLYAGPNIWGLPEPVYLIIRIPYHTLLNLFGISIVTNVVPFCKPILNFELPKILQFYKFRSIGICPWSYEHLLFVVSIVLSVFSIAPLILVKKVYKKHIKIENILMLIVYYYGMIMFVISFFISCDIYRVIGYGWPLFWLTIPYLLEKIYKDKLYSLRPLLIYYIIVNWTIFISTKIFGYVTTNNSRLYASIFTIIICLIFYEISYRYIKNSMAEE
jgi:hypothetical protein